MKPTLKKMLSLFLCLVMCVGMAIPASATGENNELGITFEAVLDKTELTYSENDQTVKMTIRAKDDKTFSVNGIGMDITNDEALQLTAIEGSEKLGTFTKSDHYDLSTGSVTWGTSDFTDIVDVTDMLVVTFTVPGKTPAGEYTVGAENFELTNDGTNFNVWEDSASVSATLTIKDGSTPTAAYTASIDASSNEVTVDEKVDITVDVGGTTNKYSAAQVVVKYDATYLTFNQNSSTLNDAAVKAENGTITIVDHGEASDNDDDYVLNFTATKATDDAGTAVTLESAAFSPEADAKSEDLTPAELDTTTENIVINNKVYTVTLPEGFEGDETVEHGATYTFNADDTGVYYKQYEVTVKDAQGNEVTGVTVNGDATNGWSVTGITQNVTIEVTRTPMTYTVNWAGVHAEGVTGSTETTATYGEDFTFTLNAGQAPTETVNGYHYKATVTRGDADITPTPSGLTYTIAGANITGDMTITVEKVTDEAGNVTFTMTGVDITAKDKEGNAVEDGDTIKKGNNITLVLDPEDGYDYTITVKQGDGEATDVTTEFADDNQYTIENVQTAVTVDVKKTLKIGTPKVELYLTADGLNIWLLTAGDEQISGKVLTYDGGEMYWSSKYNAYAYLIIAATNPENDIDTEKFGIAEGNKAVRYDMNVNGSKETDANDAQLIWNMYNARYDNFTVVDMGKFLEADVANNTSASVTAMVNMDDAAAIVNAILNPTNG